MSVAGRCRSQNVTSLGMNDVPCPNFNTQMRCLVVLAKIGDCNGLRFVN